MVLKQNESKYIEQQDKITARVNDFISREPKKIQFFQLFRLIEFKNLR